MFPKKINSKKMIPNQIIHNNHEMKIYQFRITIKNKLHFRRNKYKKYLLIKIQTHHIYKIYNH
jgi:hypothetical protein